MTSDPLAEAVTKYLRLAPDRWVEFPFKEAASEEITAIRRLTEAGLIEQRVTARFQIPGADQVNRITFQATGEFGGKYALHAVKKDWLARYEKHFRAFPREPGDLADLIVLPERIEWRITDQGRLAKADLEKGDQCPIDFVLKRGFFDRPVRLLSDGRIYFRRPVAGHGHLLSIEKVQDKRFRMGKVGVISKLARAIAGELIPALKEAIKAILSEFKDATKAGPTEGGKPEGEFVFARDGDGWRIRAFGEEGHFKNLKGLEYVARLIERPGQRVPLEQLEGGGKGPTTDAESSLMTEFADAEGLDRDMSDQAVLDDEARRDIEKALEDLEDEIREAEHWNDLGRAETAKAKRQVLLEHYRRSTRPNGQSRRFDSDRDKQRVRIWNAIKYSCKTLKEHCMPQTADHFLISISANNGGYLYQPAPPVFWEVKET